MAGQRINLKEMARDRKGLAPVAELRSQASPAGVPAGVPIGTVALNPLNKRPPGEDAELGEMADTIRAQGLIQPLVVCSRSAYLAEFPDQAVAGEWVALIGNRRLQAANLAGLTEVPIVVNNERVTSMYEVMLVENGQRRDLPATLEAEAMEQVLRRERIPQAELARRIGKSGAYVTQRLDLLGLIPALRVAFDAGELTVRLAREVGKLPEVRQQEIVAGGKPYRITTPPPSPRRINAASPEAAAESIRKAFTPEELAELIRLLSA